MLGKVIPKKFILIISVCLLVMLIASIMDESGLLNFFAFVFSLSFIFVLTKKISNLDYFIYAVFINSSLMSGHFKFLSITSIIFGILLLSLFSIFVKKHKLIGLVDKKIIMISIIWFIYTIYNSILVSGTSINGLIYSFIPFSVLFTSVFLSQAKVNEQSKFIWTIYIAFSLIIFVSLIEHLLGHTFFSIRWTIEERYRNGILRAGSTLADPNNVCFMLVPFFFLLQTSVFKLYIPSFIRKLTIFLDFVIVILTSSRAGILALFMGIAFMIISKKRVSLIIILPVLYFGTNLLLQQFENLLNKYENSTSFREYVVAQALLVWNSHKVFGAGSTMLFSMIDGNNTMNTYVYLLGIYGLIGLVIYILYWFSILRVDIKRWLLNKKIYNDQLCKLSVFITSGIIAYSLDVLGMAFVWIIPAVFQVIDFYSKKDIDQEKWVKYE